MTYCGKELQQTPQPIFSLPLSFIKLGFESWNLRNICALFLELVIKLKIALCCSSSRPAILEMYYYGRLTDRLLLECIVFPRSAHAWATHKLTGPYGSPHGAHFVQLHDEWHGM